MKTNYPPRYAARPPYRSGTSGAPVTLELLLAFAILRQMRFTLNLYYPPARVQQN